MSNIENITPEEAYELGKQAAIEDFQKMSAAPAATPGPTPTQLALRKLKEPPAQVPLKKTLTTSTTAIAPPPPKNPLQKLQAGEGRKATVVKPTKPAPAAVTPPVSRGPNPGNYVDPRFNR